jgi:ferredoxin
LLVARTMKIRIEKSQCVGNARCNAIAEQLYPLDGDGYILSEGFDVAPGMEQLARRGARACPERIILVLEDDPPQAMDQIGSA